MDLTLSAFASIFEVFMGVGFAFYALSKIRYFVDEALEAKSGEDVTIHNNISSSKELLEELQKDLRKAGDHEKANALDDEDSKLLNSIKEEIENEKDRIIINSRYYFLFLGLFCLIVLYFCGFEEGCNVTSHKVNLYLCLLSLTVAFIACNVFLHLVVFQKDRNHSVILKIFNIILIIFLWIAVTLIAAMSLENITVEFLERLKLISIILACLVIFLPFLFLILRHNRLDYFLKNKNFRKQVERINDNIVKEKKEFIKKYPEFAKKQKPEEG